MDSHLIAQHAEMESTHWWFVARKRLIADILQRSVASGSSLRLLDVGCGAGSMVETLSALGDVTALDASHEAIAHVRSRHPHATALVGEVPDAIPRGEPFDVVTALDVIEHITDDLAALTAMREVLVPGGVLLCTVPAYQWLWSPHDDLNEHKRRYTRKALVRSLRDAGFVVERASYYNSVLFAPVVGVRLLRRLLRPGEAARSDLDVPAGPLNGLLLWLFAAERHVLRHLSLPFGVSLVAVARRPVAP
jgi:2-polyprenyl-3-methyl-5-hydroxy-6-metoxy-1,4-benzoquinol methylase